MKLQQIKYIFEVARNKLNVSATADHLFTSQPGISKNIRLLEDELGVQIFVRSGKHLTNITPAGREILPVAEDILKRINKIKEIAENYVNESAGRLNLSTTHTFSRYFLPKVIKEYRKLYPKVALHILQHDINKANVDLNDGKLDFALLQQDEPDFQDKIHLPCFFWRRCLVVPKDHILAKRDSIDFDILAQQPLLTHTYAGGSSNFVLKKFKENGFNPEVIFSATDCEVIKYYVRMGLGVGIIANMAYEKDLDEDLVKIPIDNLFEPCLVNVVFDKNFYFREYVFSFLQSLAPHLSKELILQAQQTRSQNKVAKLIDEKMIAVL